MSRRKAEFPPPRDPGLTLKRFRELEALLRARNYGPAIEWSETIQPPADCRAFAKEAVYVICNSGMRVTIANRIYWSVMRALRRRQSATSVFGHPAKAKAIDHIWANKRVLFEAYKIAEDKIAYCATLPFIGVVTKFHLAKNLGIDVAKPDVHLLRLAKGDRVTVAELCERLAAESGYRVASVDTILWRACADDHLDSSAYQAAGWDEARAEARLP